MTQFKDKSEHQPEQHQRRALQLPGAAGRRHPALRRDARAGRRGPAPAPRARARDRPPLQRSLRRDVPRAAAALLDDAQDPRARRPGEDVQVARQHDPARARPRRRSGTSCARRRPIRRASSGPIRARPRSATSSRCTSSSPTPAEAGRGPRRLHDRGHRLHRLQEEAVRGGQGGPRAIRARAEELRAQPGARRRDPRRGRRRARKVARETMARVRARLGLARRRREAARVVALPAVLAAGRRRRAGPAATPRRRLEPRGGGAVAHRGGARRQSRRRLRAPRPAHARAHRRSAGGARTGAATRGCWRPPDLVAVGWLPPAWEPAGTRILHRDGDEADVEVYSATGERQPVHTVREGKSWRVELPLR